jgi:hypothetical protein
MGFPLFGVHGRIKAWEKRSVTIVLHGFFILINLKERGVS